MRTYSRKVAGAGGKVAAKKQAAFKVLIALLKRGE